MDLTADAKIGHGKRTDSIVINLRKSLTIQTGYGAEPPILCFRNNRLFAFQIEHHHRGAPWIQFVCPENTDARLVRRLRLGIPAKKCRFKDSELLP